ncbi:hypothetical protein COU57_00695, partial [Candidatus Pacearchaeota archaeon CG10_big_fil_rev_8_21_14_0_10_32_14]
MARLEVNVEKYVEELKSNFDSDHDMMEDPEVSRIKDPSEKLRAANSWYEARLEAGYKTISSLMDKMGIYKKIKRSNGT